MSSTQPLADIANDSENETNVETGPKIEVQFYPPSNRLRSKVKVREPGDSFDASAIERAEKALDKLSVRFEGWINEEVDRLQAARDDVDKHGHRGEYADELFRAAHDLKGQGLTFGYPLVTYVAGSLCKLLEVLIEIKSKTAPIDLIDHHVDAIRAIVRNAIKDNTHNTGSELATSLAAATEAYVSILETQHNNPPEKQK